jgi:hypothetical protein
VLDLAERANVFAARPATFAVLVVGRVADFLRDTGRAAFLERAIPISSRRGGAPRAPMLFGIASTG